MATIKELLSAMIDKINGNENKIDNIKGVPEAFDSITMTNGTDIANLTMSAEKELLFDGETIGGGVTSWNDLEDKPFYTDGDGMVEILPETTIEGADDSGDGINDSLMLMLPELVSGKTYIVYWNGTEYECVGQEVKEGEIKGVLLGNGADMGLSGNNEPFIILYTSGFLEMTGGEFNSMITFTDGTTYPNPTISIYSGGAVIHKLDNKYLNLDWLPTITYSSTKTIFEETTVTVPTSGTMINNMYGVELDGIADYSEFEKLLVTVDGVEYICDVLLIDDQYIILQEGYSIDFETGTTSSIILIVNNHFFNTSGNHTVKIKNYSINYNKMPKGFLPADNVPTKAYTNLSAKTNNDHYCIYATRDEATANNSNGMSDIKLKYMWNKGRMIVVDVRNDEEYEVVAIRGEYVVITAEINNEPVLTKLYGYLD